jgi:hypothetical protein
MFSDVGSMTAFDLAEVAFGGRGSRTPRFQPL